MSHLTTFSKIQKFIDENITGQLKKLLRLLLDGNLYSYENELFDRMNALFNFISEQLLPEAAEQLVNQLSEQGRAAGGCKMEARPYKLRIATGHQIEVPSPYVKQPPKDWSGPRQLLARYWNIIDGASPGLYDRVGYCSALGPSYEVTHQTLCKFGVQVCLSSVRDITNRLAARCYEAGEENLAVRSSETLEGKRVVISVDGGRTRIRNYDGNCNSSGHATYQTAWREPKLFVIDILDENGQPERYELPIYGCRFAEADILALLRRYLRRLNVEKAKQVQILADGAPWIWNNIKPMLLGLGVPEERIVETLDYYHASSYIHSLVEEMPKRVGKKQRIAYLQEFKDWLWDGNTQQVVETCREVFKRPGQIVNRYLNYLDKHQNKTQYVEFEKQKLMCGSGIIESAIRRVINLRFKNASTFWDEGVVEKLYFLRAALLSKRWGIVMENLTKRT